jgi:hypothetical protein
VAHTIHVDKGLPFGHRLHRREPGPQGAPAKNKTDGQRGEPQNSFGGGRSIWTSVLCEAHPCRSQAHRLAARPTPTRLTRSSGS